jgi:hypothetical protein
MDDNNLTDKDKYFCGRSGCNFSTNYPQAWEKHKISHKSRPS